MTILGSITLEKETILFMSFPFAVCFSFFNLNLFCVFDKHQMAWEEKKKNSAVRKV